ncbi:DUF732 domain-containing protein [Mycobacterium avium]|uniref:DUF732 domain-containing protein n=1 Tax=Mycobacterium avium subsp. hominissuis TaxID=439334 RepID=A0A2A3LB88_MYCAV|nr:DUF732 domain-containing protein [Mycobacterium avium]PBJ37326.1 hypothetical protein XV03_07640 [Mycobacterium avium subsp. hominissuis]
MAQTNVPRWKWLTTSVILLFAAALQFAPPVSADQTDDDFLAALKKHGIVFTNRDVAITAGHKVLGLTPFSGHRVRRLLPSE